MVIGVIAIASCQKDDYAAVVYVAGYENQFAKLWKDDIEVYSYEQARSHSVFVAGKMCM